MPSDPLAQADRPEPSRSGRARADVPDLSACACRPLSTCGDGGWRAAWPSSPHARNAINTGPFSPGGPSGERNETLHPCPPWRCADLRPGLLHQQQPQPRHDRAGCPDRPAPPADNRRLRRPADRHLRIRRAGRRPARPPPTRPTCTGRSGSEPTARSSPQGRRTSWSWCSSRLGRREPPGQWTCSTVPPGSSTTSRPSPASRYWSQIPAQEARSAAPTPHGVLPGHVELRGLEPLTPCLQRSWTWPPDRAHCW